jgi:nucleoid DNA-binding protein
VDRKELPAGRETVAARVRQALNLSSDREADNIVNVVIDSIVAVMKENIEVDGFTLKLPSFGNSKFVTNRARCGRFP